MDNMPHMPKQSKVKNTVIASFFLVTLISRRFFKTDRGGPYSKGICKIADSQTVVIHI